MINDRTIEDTKSILSKEKTPKWLQNRDDQEENKEINDDTLEEDRQAFLEKLNQKWKEEDN